MDKLIDKIKEISKDPKGKAFLFFGFYIIVCIFSETMIKYKEHP